MAKKVVLVVDDEPAIVSAVTETLNEKFDIITATTGKEALEEIYQHNPDLVLMDVMMPDMDGFAAVKELHTARPQGYPPIIFLSARTGRADIEQGLKIGGFDYITKPFSPSMLIKSINEVLERVEIRKKIQQKNKNL
jgi:DNA-binding response OmpR family regulator